MKLSEHFTTDEFKCNCHRKRDVPYCNGLPEGGMDPKLIDVLEQIREICGDRPVTILSGYRCEQYNKEVGGVKSSQHKNGTAADIMIEGVSVGDIATAAGTVLGDSGGIGRYHRQGFVHVDVRRNRARWRG